VPMLTLTNAPVDHLLASAAGAFDPTTNSMCGASQSGIGLRHVMLAQDALSGLGILRNPPTHRRSLVVDVERRAVRVR
jgi:hypothetical protein